MKEEEKARKSFPTQLQYSAERNDPSLPFLPHGPIWPAAQLRAQAGGSHRARSPKRPRQGAYLTGASDRKVERHRAAITADPDRMATPNVAAIDQQAPNTGPDAACQNR